MKQTGKLEARLPKRRAVDAASNPSMNRNYGQFLSDRQLFVSVFEIRCGDNCHKHSKVGDSSVSGELVLAKRTVEWMDGWTDRRTSERTVSRSMMGTG